MPSMGGNNNCGEVYALTLLEHVVVFEIDIVTVCTDSVTSVRWRVVIVHNERTWFSGEYTSAVATVVSSVEERERFPTLVARGCRLIGDPVGFPTFLKHKSHIRGPAQHARKGSVLR